MTKDAVPEYFIDGISFRSHTFGMVLVGVKSLAPTPDKQEDKDNNLMAALTGVKPTVESEPQFVLRMSLEQANVIAMLFRRSLKSYEQQTETVIGIPGKLLESLGMTSADW